MSSTRPEPDLDAEREVDLGRYLDALVARWWLPLLGLVVGVALGYLLAVGGKEVYRAQATVYVGTPYGPGGNATLQSLATNPNSVGRIARGQETIEQVSQESGMSPRELRAGVSTRADQERRPEDGPQPAVRSLGAGRPARRGQCGDGGDRRANRRRGRRLREAQAADLPGPARV